MVRNSLNKFMIFTFNETQNSTYGELKQNNKDVFWLKS
jgi:hypothetical protein